MDGDRDVVSDRAVETVPVVVPTPSLQLFAGVGKRQEPVCVQPLRSQLAVEREEGSGKAPAGRFPRRNVKPLSVGLPGREKSRVT